MMISIITLAMILIPRTFATDFILITVLYRTIFSNYTQYTTSAIACERYAYMEAGKFLVGYMLGLPISYFDTRGPSSRSDFYQLRPTGKVQNAIHFLLYFLFLQAHSHSFSFLLFSFPPTLLFKHALPPLPPLPPPLYTRTYGVVRDRPSHVLSFLVHPIRYGPGLGCLSRYP